MEGIFRTARLGSAGAQRAYALIQFFDPGLKFEDWLAWLDGGTGEAPQLLAIEDARGYTHAVFNCRIENDPRRGRLLRMTTLACSGLPSRVLHEAIFDGAERQARESGCAGVMLEIADAAPTEARSAVASLNSAVGTRFSRLSSTWFLPVA